MIIRVRSRRTLPGPVRGGCDKKFGYVIRRLSRRITQARVTPSRAGGIKSLFGGGRGEGARCVLMRNTEVQTDAFGRRKEKNQREGASDVKGKTSAKLGRRTRGGNVAVIPINVKRALLWSAIQKQFAAGGVVLGVSCRERVFPRIRNIGCDLPDGKLRPRINVAPAFPTGSSGSALWSFQLAREIKRCLAAPGDRGLRIIQAPIQVISNIARGMRATKRVKSFLILTSSCVSKVQHDALHADAKRSSKDFNQ